MLRRPGASPADQTATALPVASTDMRRSINAGEATVTAFDHWGRIAPLDAVPETVDLPGVDVADGFVAASAANTGEVNATIVAVATKTRLRFMGPHSGSWKRQQIYRSPSVLHRASLNRVHLDILPLT
jgi:hypothetical protein